MEKEARNLLPPTGFEAVTSGKPPKESMSLSAAHLALVHRSLVKAGLAGNLRYNGDPLLGKAEKKCVVLLTTRPPVGVNTRGSLVMFACRARCGVFDRGEHDTVGALGPKIVSMLLTWSMPMEL